MAISEELKRLYTSNDVGVRYYDTLELSHSEFSQVYYLVRDSKAHTWNLGGPDAVFQPYPFELVLPEVGSSQQDITITLDNVSRVMTREMENASKNIREPIKAVYRVYMDGLTESQIYPMSLLLSDVVVNVFSVAATASRPSLYEKVVPSGIHSTYDSRFKGLWL